MKFTRIALSAALAAALCAGSALADPGENHGHGHGANRGEDSNKSQGQYQQYNTPQYTPPQHSRGRHLGRYRHLQTGYLSDAQIAYALHNRSAEIARIRSLRSIDYNRVRIVRLTAAQKARFGVGMSTINTVAFDQFAMPDAGSAQVAQIFGGNSSGIGGILTQLVESIVINNVVNNATGGAINQGYGNDPYGNNNYGGGASLANVLLNSGIPLSSLLGVLMGGNGILNAIVG